MTKTPIPAEEVRFFSGSSNPTLAASIASNLGVPLDDTPISRFSNDNLYIQLGSTVRYRRVYIVQSLSQPTNDHLMELLMLLDIARAADQPRKSTRLFRITRSVAPIKRTRHGSPSRRVWWRTSSRPPEPPM